MLALGELLKQNKDFAKLMQKLEAGECPIALSGLSAIHKAHVIAAVRMITKKQIVCIYADELDVRRAAKDIEIMCGEAPRILPVLERSFHDVDSFSHEFEHERIATLKALADGVCGITLAPVFALMQRTAPRETVAGKAIALKLGMEIVQEKLMSDLVAYGYTRAEQVEGEGQFAVRGGIVDVFSPGQENPVRIEFFGDEIDSMGFFETETQRRIENTKAIKLLPATTLENSAYEALGEKLSEALARENRRKKKNERLIKTLESDMELVENGLPLRARDRYFNLIYPEHTCGLDYISEDAIIFVDDYYRIRDAAGREKKREVEDIKSLIFSGFLLPDTDCLCEDFELVQRFISESKSVFLEAFVRAEYGISPKAVLSMVARSLPSYGGNLELACSEISEYLEDGNRVVILTGSAKSAENMQVLLRERGINASIDLMLAHLPQEACVIIAVGVLSAGFAYPGNDFALFTEGQLMRAPSKRGRIKRDKKNSRKINNYRDLTPGCLVVHDLHGIGRFAGISKIKTDGVEKDYIKIMYLGTDALYVPVTQLDMVSKYIGGGEDGGVRLSKLGGAEWHKAKLRARGAAKELAEELIKLYAARQSLEREPFPADSDWQKEFEEGFEFEDTDDQLRCSNEIKGDMERNYPMDRLLCGDVGFGKTEVAFRAAMKCILGGKQVAILVPTTVLAEQHYITACRRFSNYPIKIGLTSRFCSDRRNKETLRGAKTGELDMIIGTHKLLAKTVSFKKLGLLIVDEEQRFGVSHKERLKEMTKEVDVLTLTATPIPRTLNMALSGIRDMSIMEEAPRNRHPVLTYVFEHDREIIADAIRKEIARGGQVFYLHNNVASIEVCAARVSKLVPGVTVAVGHGQMGEGELSEVMRKMSEGEIQVLVCTTIIETGIDIPNANTLIIEDADKMGLAQLHQIRGRVGRSNRHAYAYLTYRRGKALSEIAEKRLAAIKEYVEFGSGFKIAMRDLELRGAGNVLGAEQSGHMMSVGYDMYLKLLENAIAEEKGETAPNAETCSADLTVSANIPERYVASSETRMDLYRRIASIEDRDDADDVIDELCDRFGEPPRETMTLIDIALLRSAAAEAGISDITQKGQSIKITMVDPTFDVISKLCARAEYKGKILLNAGQEPYLMLKLKSGDEPIDSTQKFIKAYKEAKEQTEQDA
ncbi:MAG: transcription-repair coupling factor [Oscillospiraceae bacterium]|nr:transcription-repair coupling factor [Oscillospiraceae bacterium]